MYSGSSIRSYAKSSDNETPQDKITFSNLMNEIDKYYSILYEHTSDKSISSKDNLDTIKNEVKKRRLLQVFPTNSR
jgi:hypothetical protein